MLQHLDTIIAFAAVMLGVSVLVTALTQMINAVLGLRGLSLQWGLETLLEHIDPEFKAHSRKIVDKILRHPLISHTGRRRATAIRREEFVDLLEEVVSKENIAIGATAAEAQRPEKTITSSATANPGASRFKFKAPEQYRKEIEKWFDGVMDRVSERFALRCRWASVSLAVVLAFACHLDSIALLEKLSTDTELRASLVQSTDTMVNRASEVFAASSDAYAEAVIRLKASNADAQVLAPPPSFFSIDAAEDWIRTQIGDSARAQTLIDEYDAILQKVLKEKTGRLASVADSVRADFKKTRFIIIPSPYPQWPFGWRAIAGMIVSSLLLSLGAPFWYNVLKNLASLRPRVAAIVQQGGEEPEQKPATPEG